MQNPWYKPLLTGLSTAYGASAGSFIMAGNFGAGDKLLLVAEKLQPNAFWALVNRSFYLAKLQEHEKALIVCQKAIEIDARNPFPQNNKASVEISLEQFERALETATLALSLCTQFHRVVPQFARTNRAAALVGLGRIDEARKDAEELFRINKKSSLGFIILGKISSKLGEDHKALDEFSKALATADLTYIPDVLDYRAAVYEKLGDQSAGKCDREKACAMREAWQKDSVLQRLKNVWSSLLKQPLLALLILLIGIKGPGALFMLSSLLITAVALVRSTTGTFIGMLVACIWLTILINFGFVGGWVKTRGGPITIETQTFDNKNLDLDEWKGKTVFLYSVTPDSTKGMHDFPTIMNVYTKYPRDKVEVVGIINSDKGKIFEDKSGVTKSPWPLVNSYNLNSITLKKLGDLNDQKSYLLSPLDHHVLLRSVDPEEVAAGVGWIADSSLNVEKYKQSELYYFPYLVESAMISFGLFGMFADFLLQKIVLRGNS